MDKLTVYFVLLVAFCGKDGFCKRREHKYKEDGGKIVGGNDTTIQNYPYQAYLLLTDGSDNFQCGGAIVNKFFIVTAAHCLAGMQSISVRIASTDAFKGGLEYTTTSFNSHPRYDNVSSDYDAGIIKINEGMTLDGTNAKAIKMVNSGSDVADGKNVIVSGWGATSENGPTSNTLMVASVPAVGRKRCNELLPNEVTSRMFCAGTPEGGKDTCQGDSGGPAVTDGLLAGITSFGYGCARPNSPGVYTRIGNFNIRSYIRTMTGS